MSAVQSRASASRADQRRTSRLARLVIAAMVPASVVAGCGRGPEPTEVQSPPAAVAGRNLLEREPDAKLEQAGRVEPDRQVGFGAAGVGPWSARSVVQGATQRAMVPCQDRRAGVRLVATAPEDRVIGAWIAGPAAAGDVPEKLAARVYLNGVQLDEFELTLDAQRYEFEAPAAAWLAGDNLFEVHVKDVHGNTPSGPLAFYLGAVEYDEPREVRRAGDALVLPRDTSIVYRVEPLTAGRLHLAGRATELGQVDCQLTAPDGALVGESSTILEQGDSLATQFEVEPGAGPYELKLSFRGDPGAEFNVEQLALEEPEDLARTPIVWIAIDTLAARNLELYGYARETAPNLTAFAEESVVFERCMANAPWTLTSFFASLSGLYPSAHDLPDDPTRARNWIAQWERRVLAPARWTLAEALRSAGWRTGAFVDHTWLVENYGVDQGFDVFDHTSAWIPNTDRSGGISRVGRLALEWFDKLPAEDPYFLFVHCFDVHGPYASDPAFTERFAAMPRAKELPAEMPSNGLVRAFDVIPSFVAEVHSALRPLGDTLDPGPIVDAYDAGIAETDAKFGRLMLELKQRGVLDEAVIVIFADHGESLTEDHRLFGHGTINEEVAHVPLIVRLPGGRGGGRRIAEQTQLVDLVPTMLEVAGLETDGRGLHGRSLMPALRGKELGSQVVLIEGGGLDQQAIIKDGWKLVRHNPHVGEPSMRMSYPELPREWIEEHAPELIGNGLTQARMNVVAKRFGGMLELDNALKEQLATRYEWLYYLPDDPNEERDVKAAEPERLAEMQRLMDAELERSHASRLENVTLVEPEIGDEQRAALQAAGYIDADE